MAAKSAASAPAGVPPCAMMKAGLYVAASVASTVASKLPEVTPRGNPGNVGTVVATPAVGVGAGDVEQPAESGAVLRGVDGDQDVGALLVLGAQGPGVQQVLAGLNQRVGVEPRAAHLPAPGRHHVLPADHLLFRGEGAVVEPAVDLLLEDRE